ncbi:hypothetical protein ATK17_1124 [Branchiibius hedensis]|uniref:Uncharacterized protein n=1 Tax=Branchiibius hedensis TaxID=672460 RepID=A0A2Y8ZVB9_9MICO|nr:hypothetical protein [Branchiibius hedensis]PWJ25012.1 hypothetical protein ATK17_1124 [Branchiibius hedensis]SSA33827.1 hypothetical protein SAMN04489750_1124 [Branchiibius hedensis]
MNLSTQTSQTAVPALWRRTQARLLTLLLAVLVALATVISGAAPADAAVVGGRLACDAQSDTVTTTTTLFANVRNAGNGQYVSIRTTAIDIYRGRMVYGPWSSTSWVPAAGYGTAATFVQSVRGGSDWNKTLVQTQIAWWVWTSSGWKYTITTQDAMYGSVCNLGGYVIG